MRPVSPWFAIAVFGLSACAAESEERPEPETPQLTIEDQSSNAPPPPPPSAPPSDAQPSSAAPPEPASAMNEPTSPPPGQAPASNAGTPPAPPSAAAQSAPIEPEPPAAAPPDSARWSHEYATGRWVYANDYGWLWVPADTDSVDEEGVPYTYLYTPRSGWNWYVSPWGPGRYHYGGWVRRPYRPVGFHGSWVAHPRVVVRLGGGGGDRAYRHRGRWH